MGTFYTLEKPEKSLKPDKEKPGPPEARYIKARARPKPEKSRPGTSLLYTYISTLMTTAVRGRLRPHSLLWPFYGLWSICKHLPFSESFGG